MSQQNNYQGLRDNVVNIIIIGVALIAGVGLGISNPIIGIAIIGLTAFFSFLQMKSTIYLGISGVLFLFFFLLSAFGISFFAGYELVFLMLLFGYIVIGTCVGFLAGRVTQYMLSNPGKEHRNNSSKKYILIGVIVIAILLIGNFYIQEHKILREVNKRETLIKLLFEKISDESFRSFSTSNIIQTNKIEGIFKTQGDRIINSYGGDVIINGNEKGVSIKFTKIPGGENCGIFWRFNNHVSEGFLSVIVDGNKRDVQISDVVKYNAFIERACENKKNVDVEFVGEWGDIEEAYKRRQRIRR